MILPVTNNFGTSRRSLVRLGMHIVPLEVIPFSHFLFP